MNSEEMLRPSHMTKTRPQSIRYAPSGCTAAVVSGAGAGRTILRQHETLLQAQQSVRDTQSL